MEGELGPGLNLKRALDQAAYLEHFRVKPWEAQAITPADKVDNFRSIALCSLVYGDPWAMFRRGRTQQMARFEALLEATRALVPHALIDEYEQALAALREL